MFQLENSRRPAIFSWLVVTYCVVISLAEVDFSQWTPSRELETSTPPQNTSNFQKRDIPSQQDILKAVQSPPDTNFFWTGRFNPCTEEQDSVIRAVEKSAAERSAKTLEMRLRDAGVDMPPFDAGPEADAAWKFAASSYAAATSGIAWVFEGQCVRPNNTWNDVEMPALLANGNTKCIFQLNVNISFFHVDLLWNYDINDNYCFFQVEYYQTALLCLLWDEGWWARQPTLRGLWNGATEMPRSTYRQEKFWLYGGELSTWSSTEYLFSAEADLESNYPGTGEPGVDPNDGGQPYMHDYVQNHYWTSGVFYRRGQHYPDLVSMQYAAVLPYNDPTRCRLSLSTTDIDLTLRILPLGDSITYGYLSSDGNGYREYLGAMLPNSTVEFIGSVQSGNMTDNYNEGHPGAEIAQIASFATNTLSERPNVVLLMAGTNDINNNDNVDTAPDRLSALIDQIVSACPDAAVLVAQIIANGNADAENRVIDFNNQVVRVTMEHYAAGNKVWPVDMSRIDERELQDGLHPTNDGYFRMAQNWFYAIKQANSFGWIQPPVAGLSRPGGVYCDHNPTWIPQGEIANGADFGANGDETECTEYEEDSTRCTCLTQSGTDTLELKPASGNCTDLNDNSTAVFFADLNGDGRAEYLWLDVNGSTTCFLNLGGPDQGADAAKISWLPQGTIATGVGARRRQVRFADLNGDGRAEYIYVHDDSSIEAWLNLGGPDDGPNAARVSWLAQGVIASGIGEDGDGVRFADLNGDGRAEYLWVDKVTGAVTAYLNLGGPDDGPDAAKISWLPQGVIATGVGVGRDNVIFADINGDGRADYLTIDFATGAVSAWLNGGGPDDGPNAAKVVWYPQGVIATGVGTGGRGISFADLNGDSRAEYLDVNPETSAVNAWLNGC